MAKESGEEPMETEEQGMRGGFGGLDPAELLRQGAAADTLSGASPPLELQALEDLVPLFPRFEILELIGKGGMGAVYKVRQRELDRIVALKILPPSIGKDEAFSDRFTREARALAKLNHPGIVTLHEFGRAGELYFILMEYVDGVNLRQLLANGRLYPREALAIVPQICDALQFAHDRGIVHRDIKPENILLDRLGRVKVADFGLAKLAAEEVAAEPGGTGEGESFVTEAGKVMGTPRYMAPEQEANPREVDHRADIYALGVVFYQMLTGELPGEGLPAPSRKVRVDVRLDEIVLRALEKNPEMRFQQASAMKTMVEDLDAFHPAAAPPVPADMWGLDYRSKAMLFGLPWLHVTGGMDPVTGRVRVAKGILAIGGHARGVLAFGGVATGGVAFGGVATGVVAFGGAAFGVVSWGGLAMGLGLAIGGLAVGGSAIGGAAIGYYGYGGLALATHALDSMTRDPAAKAFFLPWADLLMRYMGLLQAGTMAVMLLVFLGVPAWITSRQAKAGRGAGRKVSWWPLLLLGMVPALNWFLQEWAAERPESPRISSRAAPPVATADPLPAGREIRIGMRGVGTPMLDERLTTDEDLVQALQFAAARNPETSVVIQPDQGVRPQRVEAIREMAAACGFFNVKVVPWGRPELMAMGWWHLIAAGGGRLWRPDGGEFTERDSLPRFADLNGAEESPSPPTWLYIPDQGASRYLCLWFRAPDADSRSIAQIRLLDAGGGSPLPASEPDGVLKMTIPFRADHGRGWIAATVFAGTSGATATKATVELASSGGPWWVYDEFPGDFSGTTTLGDGIFTSGGAQGPDGRAFLSVTLDLSLDKGFHQLGFVAVTKDGRQLEGSLPVRSGGGQVVTERTTFDTGLVEVEKFLCRKRTIHRGLYPVVMDRDSIGASGGVRIEFDPRGESMGEVVERLRNIYDLPLCFEEMDYGDNPPVITPDDRIARWERVSGQRPLNAVERQVLETWRMHKRNGTHAGVRVRTVGRAIEGVVVADTVDDLLEKLTKNTEYLWRTTGNLQVIMPRERSALLSGVNLDTGGLGVQEVFKSIVPGAVSFNMALAGSLPDITRTICPPRNFVRTPAWEAISGICDGFSPRLIWSYVDPGGGKRFYYAPCRGDEMQAALAATRWLMRIDREVEGAYPRQVPDSERSWTVASAYFRNGVPREQWQKVLDKVRRPLGQALSRGLKGIRVEQAHTGEGRLVLEVHTRFASEGAGVETVRLVRENDGVWRAAGYNIR